MITDTHLGEIYDIVEAATKHERHLSEFENSFIHEWASRLDAFGHRVSISDKQQFVFDKIKLKCSQIDRASSDIRDDAGNSPRDS